MFIVIYKEGRQHSEPLIKETLAQAMALPTDKFIFSWEGHFYGYELYKPMGIWFYDGDNKESVFNFGRYELTHVAHKFKSGNSLTDTSFYDYEFIFREDNKRDVVITATVMQRDFPKAFSNAIKEIISASRFTSWSEYQQNKAEMKEVERLKAEVATLQKENESLRKKLAEQKLEHAKTL